MNATTSTLRGSAKRQPNLALSFQIPRAALIWILAAVVLVLAPQTARMPLWISGVALLCIGWRILIYRGTLNYPGRPLRVVIVVFTLVVSVAQLSSLGVGLDAAASLLALGFVFKLIEMQHKRDIYVVISLCFVLGMVSFLYSQSIINTLYVFISSTVTLAAMVSLNRSSLVSSNRSTFALSTRIALQAIPLTIVLFLVFPRIAPLWAVPVQNSGSTTGISDEMTPGDIAELGRSAELAFRVSFNGRPPPIHQELYWRGLVLDDFDGETWNRQRFSFYQNARNQGNFNLDWDGRKVEGGQPLDYNIIIEATQRPWLFGLHLANTGNEDMYQSSNFELFNNGLITQRLSYDLTSFPQSQTDLVLSQRQRNRSLELPETGNARSREFAQELRATVATDTDYAWQVMAHFQQEEFFYTLEPGVLGENRIDEFLFDSRRGFCEHYASTFTYLMRAAGIPARVVVGYQGAEYNRFEDYLMVYQYNAHAWTEIWLEDRGWVRFDPTAAVSPERVELGVEEALRDDPAFMEEALFSAARLGGINWLNTLRLRLDALEYEWNRRVVNYDEEVQFELFERLFGEVTKTRILVFLAAIAIITVLLVALTIVRFKPKTRYHPINKVYVNLCQQMEKAGVPRLKGEGPLDYCARVSQLRPELKHQFEELTKLYVELMYQDAELFQPSADAKTGTVKLGALGKKKLAELKRAVRQFSFVRA